MQMGAGGFAACVGWTTAGCDAGGVGWTTGAVGVGVSVGVGCDAGAVGVDIINANCVAWTLRVSCSCSNSSLETLLLNVPQAVKKTTDNNKVTRERDLLMVPPDEIR